MRKSILIKLRSLYRQYIQHTVKEWEEIGEKVPKIPLSNTIVMVKMPFGQRVKFLFTNNEKYRLTQSQLNIINYSSYRLKNE
jgi:hypothetical protein